VQAALRQVATQGYVTWAAWAAQGLIGDMGALLAEDPVLRSTAVPLSWVETKVGGGDGVTGGLDAGDDEAIRFSLPAAASPAVLTCLMQACWVSRGAWVGCLCGGVGGGGCRSGFKTTLRSQWC
jgi:hypothetical protein